MNHTVSVIFVEIDFLISVTHSCASVILFRWFTRARIISLFVIRARWHSVWFTTLKITYKRTVKLNIYTNTSLRTSGLPLQICNLLRLLDRES